MNEHTVDLITSLGPVTADFSRSQLTGSGIAAVRTGPGFGINHHEYSGAVFLNGPGWAGPQRSSSGTSRGTGSVPGCHSRRPASRAAGNAPKNTASTLVSHTRVSAAPGQK
jgi:hypothetical protein